MIKKKYQITPAFFQEVYVRQEWESQWELFQLVRDWEQIVESHIAEMSMPAYFRGQELYVYVDNSALMQQLQFLQHDLLGKVNQVLRRKKITGFRWLLKPHDEERLLEEKKIMPFRSVDTTECHTFRDMVSGIEDDTCRKALYRLWYSFKTR